MKGKVENTNKSEPKGRPFYKFPIFGGMMFFLLISIILFYLLFTDKIPEKFLLPLYSIAITLFIFGLILLCSVFFYYSVMVKQFSGDMRIFSRRIDKIINEIENPDPQNKKDKGSLFKFEKLTITFKFPFGRIETEAVRKKESERNKK